MLSNFAIVGRLNLLKLALANLSPVTTPQVREEFRAGAQKGLFQETDIQWLEIVRLSQRERQRYETFRQRFGEGEASCLAVALERNIPLATDDMKARKLLQQFGGTVTGTLGLLKRLVRERFLSIEEGDAVLADMIREGYFSPVKSLTELS